MNIINLPTYANEYPFIVAIEENNEFYFYGAYSSWQRATDVANEIEGFVVFRG